MSSFSSGEPSASPHCRPPPRQPSRTFHRSESVGAVNSLLGWLYLRSADQPAPTPSAANGRSARADCAAGYHPKLDGTSYSRPRAGSARRITNPSRAIPTPTPASARDPRPTMSSPSRDRRLRRDAQLLHTASFRLSDGASRRHAERSGPAPTPRVGVRCCHPSGTRRGWPHTSRRHRGRWSARAHCSTRRARTAAGHARRRRPIAQLLGRSLDEMVAVSASATFEPPKIARPRRADRS